ncbi:MAG: helix-turn-helix domain-containing protein, partial [Rickettsiales bacterium]|nr:helix-turn-helix domain-containing protein [Rickettsiales bacterium]
MTKENIDAHVGKRLRLRRTMMGLSQEALAKAVGITFQQVQKYEKGVNAMNANRLYEFSQFMHIPISYFFEGLNQPGEN